MKNSLQSIAGLFLLLTFALASSVAASAASPCKVIVLKFATHPALDELEVNFISSLKSRLTNVVIETLNANGNPVSAKQLAESATRPGVDLIVTLATPVTQAAAKTPSDIPLLYAAVSEKTFLSSGQFARSCGAIAEKSSLSPIRLIFSPYW